MFFSLENIGVVNLEMLTAKGAEHYYGSGRLFLGDLHKLRLSEALIVSLFNSRRAQTGEAKLFSPPGATQRGNGQGLSISVSQLADPPNEMCHSSQQLTASPPFWGIQGLAGRARPTV